MERVIEVDKLSLEQSLARWSQGIALKAALLGQACEKTVLIEAGRLVETLIEISPVAKAKDIETDVRAKFVGLGQDHSRKASSDSISGLGSVDWYAFQPNAIFGVAKTEDMRGASVEDLYKVNQQVKKINKQGRAVVGRRGKQTVYLWKKVVTKAETVNALILRLKRHRGRLAASWFEGLKQLVMSGYRQKKTLPGYIEGNTEGSRGSAINMLSVKDNPSFTIESHAIGINNRGTEYQILSALRIRFKAMEKRLAFLVKYPEKISEEQ